MICLSAHLIFFNVVSMEIQKSVSPKNGHFNMKCYISASICQTFWNDISLKLSLFTRKKLSHFIEMIRRRLFIPFSVHLSQK